MLCDRFGFRGDRARTLVRDLSGGERRRLQLMRLLMDEPNVLLLDEPTNDLDIDTLTALEDLLDRWPGTLVVVSHDRYFVERVCDNVHALHRRRRDPPPAGRHRPVPRVAPRASAALAPALRRSGARASRPARRARARKEIQRLERALERLGEREAELHAAMAAAATDHERLRELQARARRAPRPSASGLEAAWLEVAETLEA